MARGVIVEGVTGAGKSSTLAALARCSARPAWLAAARLIPEEDTTGELMTEELRNPALTDRERCHRLWTIAARLDAAAQDEGFVLERFHLTYFALIPDWSLYDALDARLAAMGFRLVLLTVPEERLRARSLYREEAEQWGAGMIDHFGSETAALAAIESSQRRRIESLGRTRLPALQIDTSARDWEAHALAIATFCSAPAPEPTGSRR